MAHKLATVSRVTPGVHWHALEDDLVVGRGHALHRADSKVFLAVDSWRDDIFAVLAEAMIADLEQPVYTVVAADDREHLGRWARAGFTDNRREDEFAVPTDPAVTGLGGVLPPPGYTLVSADKVELAGLQQLDHELRREVAGSQTWSSPLEEFERATVASPFFDPATSLVALHHPDAGAVDAQLAGLVRIQGARRQPRLLLLGVRPGHRRHGVARALLAAALGPLHERGVASVAAEADLTAGPAQTLLRSLGSTRTGGAIELVHRP
jgi:GNAT superfamily N-acetyltransferase